ncbi:TIGR03643 family protein [Thiomicrorhabdus sp. Kp2]|uniref:TIGR03643 family protein n=1 Tax=Thiomicrorhabdus sp. Kp2 TaxID=1123518 RepID=UPI0004254F29|nr:TIGR03643 family protein [Thiomicrorhabdus sp. Kp2]
MSEKIHHFLDFSDEDVSRIIEMAWEDRTPFEAIESNYGLAEHQVIKLMRQNLKQKTFKVWRTRVSGRKTKHQHLRDKNVLRHHCKTQYKVRSGW